MSETIYTLAKAAKGFNNYHLVAGVRLTDYVGSLDDWRTFAACVTFADNHFSSATLGSLEIEIEGGWHLWHSARRPGVHFTQAEAEALAARIDALPRRSATVTEPVSEITRGIIADLTARDLKGQREYGTTMDRADLTPLEWLDHEYAELLDAAQYNRAARRRVEKMGKELGGMRAQLLAVLDFRDRDSSVGGFHVMCEDIEALLKGEEVAG